VIAGGQSGQIAGGLLHPAMPTQPEASADSFLQPPLHFPSKQPIALMTDGAESLLRLRAFMPGPIRFVLDYFHVSMKLQHIDQCIDAIPPIVFSPDGSVFELYDRFNYLRGYSWFGRRAKFEVR
jgi:hypothetical protein